MRANRSRRCLNNQLRAKGRGIAQATSLWHYLNREIPDNVTTRILGFVLRSDAILLMNRNFQVN